MTKQVKLYANMRWFDAAEEPSDISELPAPFRQALEIWNLEGDEGFDKISELISPYLRARYLPSNVANWESIFQAEDMLEFESEKVRIVGIKWDGATFPTCSAESIFQIPVTHDFQDTDMEEWQENNGLLVDGVVFYWDVPRSDETEDLDFTAGSNLGVECAVVDSEPF